MKTFQYFLLFLVFPLCLFGDEKDGVRLYDVVILKESGQRFEGKVKVEGNTVILHLKEGGILQFDREKVTILPARLPKQVYAERAARLSPSDGAGHFALALFCLKYRLWKEARRELLIAALANPPEKKAYSLLAKIYKRERPSPPLSQEDQEALKRELAFYLLAEQKGIHLPELAFQKGEVLKLLSQVHFAIATWEKVRKKREELPKELQVELYLLLGNSYLEIGKREKAREILNEGLSLFELTPSKLFAFHLSLGKTYLPENLEESEKHLQKALQYSQNLGEEEKGKALLYLGILHYLQGKKESVQNFQKALQTFQKLSPLPQNLLFVTRFNLLFALLRFAPKEEAEKEWKKWQEEKQSLPSSLEKLLQGWYSLVLQKDFATFYQKVRDFAKVSRSPGFFYFLLGWNALFYRQTGLAKEYFEKAWQQGFSPSDCLAGLARLALLKENWKEAAKQYGYLLANPSFQFLTIPKVQIQKEYSYCLFRLGKQKEALELIEQVLALSPKDVFSLRLKSYLYYQKAVQSQKEEDRAKAKQVVLSALRLLPKDIYLQSLLSQIEAVEKLKSWEDNFHRPNSPRPYNQWRLQAKYGIEVKIDSQTLLFEGVQKGEEATFCYRLLKSNEFARIVVLFDLPTLPKKAQIGLQIQGESYGQIQSLLKLYGTSQGFFAEWQNGREVRPPFLISPPKQGEITLEISRVGKKGLLLKVGDQGVTLTLSRRLRGETYRVGIFCLFPLRESVRFRVRKVLLYKYRKSP